MLTQSKIKSVQDLISDLSKEEIIWLNGYLAGLISTSPQPVENVSAASLVSKITIAYGTETGNSKKLATAFAAKAKKNGMQVKLIALEQYKHADLVKEEWLFLIISTHGDGEAPAAAKKFYDHIHQNDLTLAKLKYGVLALGNTAYPMFCKAGEDVDIRLHQSGAERILPLQKLDTDYAGDAEQWFNQVLQSFSSVKSSVDVPKPQIKKSAKTTCQGVVTAHINLNGRGSAKETYHIEIAAEGVGYQPGDAIGIVPKNEDALAKKILTVAAVDGNTLIPYKEQTSSIEELLVNKLSIIHLSERVVKKYAAIVQQEIPATRIDLLDLLRIYPVNSSEQFIAALQILDPIVPRLYSIASSVSAHGETVHLTVGKHTFSTPDHIKDGLCSSYLAKLKENDTIEFYVHKNHLFKLPAADKDIIMIGPGTGIAPFRSFISERDAAGTDGRSWLFFGDQHFTTDFLYQTEWQSWLETGALTKMNVAFSRDQQEKIYVQHKLLKYAPEVFNWIENGAYVYVCGAKEPMSVDVENTLLNIIQQEKQISAEEATEYLSALQEEGRYVKDVY